MEIGSLWMWQINETLFVVENPDLSSFWIEKSCCLLQHIFVFILSDFWSD